MTRKLEEDYTINEETMAIRTCTVDPNVTIVFERDQTLFINRQAFDLIKKACIEDGWCEYAGRRAAVKHHMKYHYKVPIPVIDDLFFFPTHGARNEDNVWINPDAIKSCYDGTLPGITVVQLINGEKVEVILQISSLHELYIRALRCQHHFKGTDPFHFI